MSTGGSYKPCRHVWQAICRNCGTNSADWPELRSPLCERLELAAQACHAAHLLSCEASIREAIVMLTTRTNLPQASHERGKGSQATAERDRRTETGEPR